MELTEAQRAFLDRPLHAVVATLRRDGGAVQSVVWYARDGDELWLSVAPDSVKAVHLRRDPRVSVLVIGEDGDAYLALEGTATATEELTPEDRLALVGRYLGADGARAFVARNPLPRPNVRVRIRPTRVVARNLPAGD